ncbi:ABC transporter ATP-binding protein [Hydrogenibacillus schlegelii]|uniref:ABC transporter domain-containing protein n=1 Tax=Hydrogenibacillus schlegelii TaxID=1484 RepID=A0A132N5X9_HYDSH|nr:MULTISPECIES: ABC transporter ATP-binding protein [Hydrogenibacillus]KWX05400.1 hypothetical protein TR75_07745 [Hydrogenibacillus schlegelii]OAR03295.1 hypothetical protein SA87_03810 [Hydrogenibacillus schlegelii]QZA32678.1 ABC transporter ATP-binding protein [Hydrogenibacillus sp. N12]
MLEVDGVRKAFDGRAVLDGVTFSAAPGEIVGLVGRNGAGKTTLLRTMAGIFRPDAGSVRYDGLDVYRVPEARARLFFVTDEREWLGHYTPKAFLALFSRIYPRFDREAFWARLRAFDLPPNRKVQTFSKGMKGLFYLSLALSTGAEGLLLDEPTEGLDPIYKKEALRLLVEAAAEARPLIVVATHRLEELEAIADRVLFLREGRIDGEVAVEALQTRYGKWQVALAEGVGPEALERLSGVRILARTGRVMTVLVEGAPEEVPGRLREAGALFVEPLPLRLEDVYVRKLGGTPDEG